MQFFGFSLLLSFYTTTVAISITTTIITNSTNIYTISFCLDLLRASSLIHLERKRKKEMKKDKRKERREA
jgi:hypothetical protein